MNLIRRPVGEKKAETNLNSPACSDKRLCGVSEPAKFYLRNNLCGLTPINDKAREIARLSLFADWTCAEF
jgi:hypothetical protein